MMDTEEIQIIDVNKENLRWDILKCNKYSEAKEGTFNEDPYELQIDEMCCRSGQGNIWLH